MALRDIIGQDRALRILLGTLKRNRVPSAVLLSGDYGIGKRLAAINYAKAINCIEPVDFDCCDKCISCKKIESLIHPDVLVITLENVAEALSLERRKSENKNRYEYPIEAVHKIEGVLYLSPHEGKKKIVIIDDAELMNINAANAFLKTLEEPPANSIIILVSSKPDRLIDTIRSRCINIHFYPLSSNGCETVIRKISKALDGEVDFILRMAMGRPGYAITKDFVQERQWYMKLLKGMLQGQTREIWTDKGEMKLWIDMAFIFLRDMIVHKISGNKRDLIFVQTMSDTPEIHTLIDAYKSLQQVAGLLDFNLNGQITWNYLAGIMRQCVSSI